MSAESSLQTATLDRPVTATWPVVDLLEIVPVQVDLDGATVAPQHAPRAWPAWRPGGLRRTSPRHFIAGARGRARAWNGYDRRATDQLSSLSRQLDHLCVNAVEPTEIAAGLEAVGFTDGAAEEYGCRDVFHLAERLFERTLAGRGRTGRPLLVNPWAERPLTHLARGLAFAAPGLVFVALLPQTTAVRDRVALVVAMLLGWPGSQAMALGGHLLDGRRHPAAARALLLAGGWVLGLAALVFAGVATLAGVTGRVAVLGAGQTLYLAASAVVLVLGRERLALAVLAPGVLAALLSLAPDGTLPVPSWLPVAGGAVTVAGAVVVAHLVAGRFRLADLRTARSVLTGADRREGLWQVGYGVAGTILVTLPSLGGLGDRLVSLSLVPVIWSMGLVEWRVVRLRRGSFALLNEAITLDSFRSRVSRLLAVTTGGYLAGLAVLTALVPLAGLLTTGAGPSREVLAGLAFGTALGLAFFLALVLASLGGIRVVVLALVLGLAAGLLALVVLPAVLALPVAPLVAVVLVLGPCWQAVTDPTRHM